MNQKIKMALLIIWLLNSSLVIPVVLPYNSTLLSMRFSLIGNQIFRPLL